MSSEYPGTGGDQGQEPTSQIPQVEYLGEPERQGRPGRRWGLVAAATAGVLAVAGVGAWGVTQFLSGGGPGAATAVPADALAYLSLDLDPDAGQKVEAYRTMRKFPALEEKLGSGDDPRRTIVEAFLSDAPCDDLTFADDFDPWLGDRIAVAVVPGKDEPVPFVAVQVKDQEKAAAGVEAITECGGGDSADGPGTVFTDDGYMILAEDDKTAASVANDAVSESLADDAGYQKWVDAAGGSGIVTAYVSADGPGAMFEAMDTGVGMPSESSTTYAGRAGALTGSAASPSDSPSDEPSDLPGDMPSDMPMPSDFPSEMLSGLPSDFPTEDFGSDPGFDDPGMDSGFMGGPDTDQLRELFKDFDGAAMVLRFDDGALEVETAVSKLADVWSADGADSGLVDLPATTAIGFGFGVSDTMVQDAMDSLAKSMGQDQLDGIVTEMEQQSGLSLPEDLQTLLGDGVSFSMDSSIDWSTSLAGSEVPDVPIGARIVGDPDEIQPILEKLLAAAGVQDQVSVEAGDGVVAVGPQEEYLAKLVEDGDLGDQDPFKAALPELGDSAGGLFVDFDTNDWLANLIEDQAPEPDTVNENVAPLNSLGVTGELDGDVMHGLMRLSTD